MKIENQYDHLRGLQNVKYKKGILEELMEVLSFSDLSFGSNPSKEIKKEISNRFNDKGWADKVRIGTSKLTISYLKSKVGVCFQIGNVARTYADILKLSQLYKMGVIDVGVIIVPNQLESRKMGANYAHFNRLTSELKLFKDIVPIPILVIGLSN